MTIIVERALSRMARPARVLFAALFTVAALWTLTVTARALGALATEAPSTLLAPAAYMLLLGCCVTLRDPDDLLARRVLYWASQIVLVRYLVWRAAATLPPVRIAPGALAAYGFLALEIFASWLTFMGSRNLLRRSRRSAEADSWRGWYGARPPRVAVLIATYDEPPEVL